MDYKGLGGQKRARGDAPQGDGDWTCPKCGNINFSFRTTCNLRKCGASKPAYAPPQRAAPMYSQVHEPMPAPLYMGSGTGGPPSMQMGLTPNYGVPMGIPSAAGLPYEYTSSLNMPSSYNTIPMQSSYAPPPSALMGGGVGYGMSSGLGYSSGSMLDGGYGMSLGIPRGPMLPGLGSAMYREENGSRKRRGGQDAKSDGDWTCPKCGNTNYSFRMVCNMKKCSTPKPDAPAPQFQGKPSTSETTPPDGSWTCDKCGNMNYPFRLKCNRRSCGADKPSEGKESPMSTPPSD